MRAVIFDFDGTIADTISAIREGINLVMDELGFARHTDEEVLTFVNHGSRELLRRALPERYRKDEDMVTHALALYDKHYLTVCYHTDKTYPGVRELVGRLHEKGYAIGILSNKQAPVLEKLAASLLKEGSVDAVQGVFPGAPVKPDPFLSHRICERLGVTPADCVFVGDSDVDVATAKNAGMTHVAVTWGFASEEHLTAVGATRFAHSADELEHIIYNIFSEGKTL